MSSSDETPNRTVTLESPVTAEEIKPLLDDLSIFLEQRAPHFEAAQITAALVNAIRYVFVHATPPVKANMLRNLADFFDHLVEISGMNIKPADPTSKH
jgi:hypothetical protein